MKPCCCHGWSETRGSQQAPRKKAHKGEGTKAHSGPRDQGGQILNWV